MSDVSSVWISENGNSFVYDDELKIIVIEDQLFSGISTVFLSNDIFTYGANEVITFSKTEDSLTEETLLQLPILKCSFKRDGEFGPASIFFKRNNKYFPVMDSVAAKDQFDVDDVSNIQISNLVLTAEFGSAGGVISVPKFGDITAVWLSDDATKWALNDTIEYSSDSLNNKAGFVVSIQIGDVSTYYVIKESDAPKDIVDNVVLKLRQKGIHASANGEEIYIKHDASPILFQENVFIVTRLFWATRL